MGTRTSLAIVALAAALAGLAACESFDRGVQDTRRSARDAADRVGETAGEAADGAQRAGRDAADALREGLEGGRDE